MNQPKASAKLASLQEQARVSERSRCICGFSYCWCRHPALDLCCKLADRPPAEVVLAAIARVANPGWVKEFKVRVLPGT